MTTTPAPPAEDYVLFADRRKMLSGLNKRMLFFCLPIVVLAIAACSIFGQHLPLPLQYPQYPGPHFRWVRTPPQVRDYFEALTGFLIAEFAFLWWVVGRSHRRQVKPIVTLSARGMAVDTLLTHIGEISWDEIAEVRCYSMLYRFVGIVPKDSGALCRRLGGRKAWLLWLNMAVIPLYRFVGVFVAPINIPQAYLPISAEELAGKILAYQNTFGRCSPGMPSVEGMWPPPPAGPNDK